MATLELAAGTARSTIASGDVVSSIHPVSAHSLCASFIPSPTTWQNSTQATPAGLVVCAASLLCLRSACAQNLIAPLARAAELNQINQVMVFAASVRCLLRTLVQFLQTSPNKAAEGDQSNQVMVCAGCWRWQDASQVQ